MLANSACFQTFNFSNSFVQDLSFFQGCYSAACSITKFDPSLFEYITEFILQSNVPDAFDQNYLSVSAILSTSFLFTFLTMLTSALMN